MQRARPSRYAKGPMAKIHEHCSTLLKAFRTPRSLTVAQVRSSFILCETSWRRLWEVALPELFGRLTVPNNDKRKLAHLPERSKEQKMLHKRSSLHMQKRQPS